MSWQAMEAVQDHSQLEDHTALCIMYALARSADADGIVGSGGKATSPNIDTIAGRAHCHRNTVLNWLPKLEESGELRVERFGKGRGSWNRYTIQLPMPEADQDAKEREPDRIDKLAEMVQNLAETVQANHEATVRMVQETVHNGPTHIGLDTVDTEEPKQQQPPQTPPPNGNGSSGRDFDEEYRQVVRVYEQEIAPISEHASRLIVEALREFKGDKLVEAIHIASESNVRNWRYVNGVLDRWRAEGQGMKPKRHKKTVVLLGDDGQPFKEVEVNA